MKLLSCAIAALLSSSVAVAEPPAFTISMEKIGGYRATGDGESAAEIIAYDAGTRRAFIINASDTTVDVANFADPRNIPATPVAVLDFDDVGGGVNSVAVSDGLVAVAVEADDRTDNGYVVFLDAATLQRLRTVEVGALPDMVTFTPEGDYLLVANEGEPNGDYTIDPEGTVSIIDLRNGVAAATVATADFSAYIGREDALRADGVRVYGKYTVNGVVVGSNAAQDFEPEYVAVAGPRAYVTLQENNAVGVVDIGTASVVAVAPLGYKNHNTADTGLDVNQSDSGFDLPNDNDLALFGNAVVNGINIAPWPVLGMYQPDGIATLRLPGNQVFLVTANEGDEREYDVFEERTTVGAVTLDPTAFPNAATLRTNNQLGRLRITNQLGDNDGDGDFDALYSPGARSFSIWTSGGQLVWDSGDDFESITAQRLPANFNADNESNTRDVRSRAKGPEPENVTIGRVGAQQYAFIGLERIGGVMIYDVTNPYAPTFVDYVTSRDFTVDPGSGATDSGPEGLTFVSEEHSPTGKPLLLVGNEFSKTVAVFEISKRKR